MSLNAQTDIPEKVSHWTRVCDTGSDYTDRWLCEICGRTCRTEDWGKKCNYEYCPHCGSRMEVISI